VRRLALALLLAAGAPLVSGCPTGNSAAAAARKNTAIISVVCDVPDAMIWVDERPVGEVRDARGGVRLKAGPHRLEVRHDRYHTRYIELELKAGERREVRVALVEDLD
jgi:hypothetical protein